MLVRLKPGELHESTNTKRFRLAPSVSCSANQGNWRRRFAPLLEAGGGRRRALAWVQGYPAHKKQRTPLGPFSRTMPRALWWS